MLTNTARVLSHYIILILSNHKSANLLTSMYIITMIIIFLAKEILQQTNKQLGISCNTANFLKTFLPWYATQTITPFLNVLILANQDKWQGFQPILKSVYPLMFLQSRISFYLAQLFASLLGKNPSGSFNSIGPTVGETIIGVLKIRNNYCAIKLFIFLILLYSNIRLFSIDPCKVIALIFDCFS